MTHFRIRYKIQGGHVHIRFFAGAGQNLTHGKCGDLVMTLDEFQDLLSVSSFEFVEEDK